MVSCREIRLPVPDDSGSLVDGGTAAVAAGAGFRQLSDASMSDSCRRQAVHNALLQRGRGSEP